MCIFDLHTTKAKYDLNVVLPFADLLTFHSLISSAPIIILRTV